MKKKHQEIVDEVQEILTYLQDRPWTKRWTVIDRLRTARAKINWALKLYAKEDNYG